MGASEKSAATFHPDDRPPVGEVMPERTDSTLLDRYKAEMRVSAALRAEVERLTVERDAAQEHVAYHLRDFRPGSDDRATGDLAVDMAAYSGRLKAEVERLRAGIEADQREKQMLADGWDRATRIIDTLLVPAIRDSAGHLTAWIESRGPDLGTPDLSPIIEIRDLLRSAGDPLTRRALLDGEVGR